MNVFVLLGKVLQLVEMGVQAKALKDKIEERKAKGDTIDDISSMLDVMLQEKVSELEKTIQESKES